MRSPSQKIATPVDRERTLVIMAKAPRAGAVKTRLALNLPPPVIADLYRCLLADTIALARSLDGVEVAIMCPAPDVDDLATVAVDGVGVVAQTGEGLAGGLTSAFARFATVHRRRVIALDSDSPHLPASVLETAFDALASCDLVLGPTYDGGYYLVGTTRSYPELFAGSGLGTVNALEEVLARARPLGLSVRFTDPSYDIDVAADVSRLAAELRLAPGKAPRTAAWLEQWRPGGGAAGQDRGP